MISELKKRDCDISIRLTPCNSQYLHVEMDIQGEHLEYFPASTMGEQLGAVVSAIYTLFQEKNDNHEEWKPIEYILNENDGIYTAVTKVDWDNEGNVIELIFSRKCDVNIDYENDLIDIEIKNYDKTLRTYTVKSKDLCYALAKACTEVLKEYGFYGYSYSTRKDYFKIHQLLYIKSFALLSFEARSIDENDGKASFEREIELLTFDM